jgi:hypothetical protein
MAAHLQLVVDNGPWVAGRRLENAGCLRVVAGTAFNAAAARPAAAPHDPAVQSMLGALGYAKDDPVLNALFDGHAPLLRRLHAMPDPWQGR